MSHTFTVTPNLTVPEFVTEFKAQQCDKPWIESSNLKGETLYAVEKNARCGDAPLFMAVGMSFNNHVPMVLTPDAVWITILVGLTNHIDTDPEGMRRHFVNHEGKKELVIGIDAPSLRGVSPEQWDLAIGAFSELIEEYLNPKKHSFIINNFSTTTEVDRLTSKVVLMGAMKHYFEYTAVLCCGIPQVTVAGTPEDWQDIINRAHVLSEMGLEWWTQHLIPVLEQFKAACSGYPDIDFWKRAYLTHSIGSGGDYGVSGWIHVFYPYLSAPNGVERNRYLDWTKNDERGLEWTNFPSSIVAAPVKIEDNGAEYECEFYGGLVGISMGDDFSVKPESGYVIKLKTDQDSKPRKHPFNVNGIRWTLKRDKPTPGTLYAVSEPEFVGSIRSELVVLPADDPKDLRRLGFHFGGMKSETVAYSKSFKKKKD